MELIRRPSARELCRLGVLAGSFNPPTVAHLQLARSALHHVDAVLLTVPRIFPHEKQFTGATLDQRAAMLDTLAAAEPRFGVAISDQGLFIEIAREVQAVLRNPDLWFLCGADAAERITTWDYGQPGVFHRMLDEFGLLVAPRGCHYQPPPGLLHRIKVLEIQDLDEVSSTEVRNRLQAGQNWRTLVPKNIQAQVERIYTR